MRELLPWLRLVFRHRGRLVLGAGLILATLLSGIALLAVSGWFLTETAVVGVLFAAGVQAYINLYVPGGAIRFFAVSRTVARYLERVYNHNLVLQLLTDIRVSLFDRLAGVNTQQRSTRSSAQWLSRLTADVDTLDTLYLRLIAPTALALVVTVLLVMLSWVLFDGTTALALLVLLGAALGIATVAVLRRTRGLSGRLSDRQDALRNRVIEHLGGMAELRAAGCERVHAHELLAESDHLSDAQARVDTRVGWHAAFTTLAINVAAVAALWLGFALFEQDAVSGPVWVLLPIALLGLVEVYAMLPEAFGKFGATEAAARRLNRDAQASVSLPARPTPPEPALAIRLDAVMPGAGDAPALSAPVSLSVPPGGSVGMVGPSGSGKSTLADVMAGMAAPLSGQAQAQPAAYLTQTTAVFEDTVRENLRLANPAATDDRLWQVLEAVALAHRFADNGDGLDTWLGNAGNRLSGGEARRLALARVMLSAAPLVILDEPFTGVDAPTRAQIAPRIERWFEGSTVVCLGHGPEALLASDRVLHFQAGSAGFELLEGKPGVPGQA